VFRIYYIVERRGPWLCRPWHWSGVCNVIWDVWMVSIRKNG